MFYNKKDPSKYFEDMMEQNALNISPKDKFFVSGSIPSLYKNSMPFTPFIDTLKDIKVPFDIDDLVIKLPFDINDLVDIYCGYLWIFFVTKHDVYISLSCHEKIISSKKLIFPQNIILSPSLYVDKIDSGCDHSMILLNDGTLFALGLNNNGQFGLIPDKPEQFRVNPIIISKDNFANQKVVNVVCGYYHTLVLTKNGTLYATGRNEQSQIGHPGKKNVYKFEKIFYTDEYNNIYQNNEDICLTNDPARGLVITKIASSSHNSFILTNDGKLYGTGDDRFHSMGKRINLNFKIINIPHIDLPIVDIWCTSLATFIKLSNDDIFMVGNNTNRAMFTSDVDIEEFKINKYLSNKPITQLSGLYSTIALDNDKNIYVSGNNKDYQLINTKQDNVICQHNLELSKILQKYPRTNINIQCGFKACSITLRGENRYTKYICQFITNLYKSIYANDSQLSDINITCLT